MKPNKKYHGAKQSNPALKYEIANRNIEEKLKNALKDGVWYGVLCARVIYILCKLSQHNNTQDYLDADISQIMQKKCEELLTTYIPLKEFTNKAILRDENFHGLTVDDVVKYDPTLGAYM